MARANITLKGHLSPDLVEMLAYVGDAVDRFVATDMMNYDARVISLARRYDYLVGLGGVEAFFTLVHQDGTVIVEPTDLLLDLVAKFRAVENALRPRRPES